MDGPAANEEPTAIDAAGLDIGRKYSDPPDADFPRITMRPAEALPWTIWPTSFKVETPDSVIERTIYHPHLALLRVLKDYKFDSVLDIGCGDGHEVEIFRTMASRVVGINADPNPAFPCDFFGDYQDYKADDTFDVIWCSHVLEHVRNTGLFLEKVFDDLSDGGLLALSVPYHDFKAGWDTFILGHNTRYNVCLLIFQLVAAGFDCRHISYRVYCGQISVLIKKTPNNISRTNMAPFTSDVMHWFPQEIMLDPHWAAATLGRLNWD